MARLRALVTTLVAAFAAASPAASRADPAAGEARITGHHITVRFEPTSHRLVARDVLDLDVSGGRALTVSLAGRVNGYAGEGGARVQLRMKSSESGVYG